MVMLVDAKYFGTMLRKARHDSCIKMCDAAKMFGLSQRELFRCEQGTKLIPENVLSSLFYYGFCLKRCKKETKPK